MEGSECRVIAVLRTRDELGDVLVLVMVDHGND
jgi:hypothetical protein